MKGRTDIAKRASLGWLFSIRIINVHAYSGCKATGSWYAKIRKISRSLFTHAKLEYNIPKRFLLSYDSKKSYSRRERTKRKYDDVKF